MSKTKYRGTKCKVYIVKSRVQKAKTIRAGTTLSFPSITFKGKHINFTASENIACKPASTSQSKSSKG